MRRAFPLLFLPYRRVRRSLFFATAMNSTPSPSRSPTILNMVGEGGGARSLTDWAN